MPYNVTEKLPFLPGYGHGSRVIRTSLTEDQAERLQRRLQTKFPEQEFIIVRYQKQYKYKPRHRKAQVRHRMSENRPYTVCGIFCTYSPWVHSGRYGKPMVRYSWRWVNCKNCLKRRNRNA